MEVLDVQGYALVNCLVVYFSKGLLIHGLRFLIDFRICFYRFPMVMTACVPVLVRLLQMT
jgi:hypothetical protein